MLDACTLTCRNCGIQFEFDEGQAEYFNEKGLTNYPSRCSSCQADHKARQTMTSIVCSRCGAEDTVPFTPRDFGNVLCHTCYQATKNR